MTETDEFPAGTDTFEVLVCPHDPVMVIVPVVATGAQK